MQACAIDLVDARVGAIHLAVGPGVVLRPTGGHAEQLAHADRRAVRRGIEQVAQLRRVVGGGRVQRQQTGVAQLHDRRRREALGHGGDAKGRIGVRRHVARHLAHAEAMRKEQLSVEDDAIGQAGDLAPPAVGAEDRLQLSAHVEQTRAALGIVEVRLRQRGNAKGCGHRGVLFRWAGRTVDRGRLGGVASAVRYYTMGERTDRKQQSKPSALTG